MRVEKLDRVALQVKNAEKLMDLFSDLFETTFEEYFGGDETKGEARREQKVLTEHDDVGLTTVRVVTENEDEHLRSIRERRKQGAAIKCFINQDLGLEMFDIGKAVLPPEKEGVLYVAFKVSNLDEALAEMRRKGFHLIELGKVGAYREAIFRADDFAGMRLGLVEYPTPTVVTACRVK
jgi:hypothetical protein